MLDGFSRRLIVFFAACLVVMDGRAASFTASLDRDTITLGEQATLSLIFEGGQPTKLTSPDVPGLQFGTPSRGFSQNIDFNSGQVNAKLTLAYTVVPQHEGEFTIPALTADVNGQQFTSQPLKLTVQKMNALPASAANSGNEVAFMRLSLPEKKIYASQTLTAQLQIFLRDDVQNFGNLQFTGTPADGFVLGKNAGGQRYRTQVGNRAYTVVPISIALTATKTGNLTLGPFTASLVVVLPSQNQGGDWPFNFFNQGEQKQVSIATDQINVKSLPLPAENVPPDFNGAIASFTVTASAGPTNLTVGDPVTVRVQISGRGNLDAVKLPDPLELKDFKIFPAKSTISDVDPLGVQGTKTFEIVATPQNSDVREWPQFSFTYSNSSSYFDPEDGKYHALTQPAMPLTVRAAGATPMPTIAANKNSAPENQTPQDILPIKNDLGTLVDNSTPLLSRPTFLAAQTLPVLAFLAAFVWRKRIDKLANNPRLRRRRAVAALVASGMDDLKIYATDNKPDEFFATLFRLLQEQLGERLDCPASAITENVVEENSILRTAPETTRTALREQFQLCNQARYAPVRGTSELNSVSAQFERLIGQLREVKS